MKPRKLARIWRADVICAHTRAAKVNNACCVAFERNGEDASLQRTRDSRDFFIRFCGKPELLPSAVIVRYSSVTTSVTTLSEIGRNSRGYESSSYKGLDWWFNLLMRNWIYSMVHCIWSNKLYRVSYQLNSDALDRLVKNDIRMPLRALQFDLISPLERNAWVSYGCVNVN